MQRIGLVRAAFILVLVGTCGASAEVPEFTPQVTDVTVFKDGHALVMARGQAKFVEGTCRTRQVPVPVLGAFWTFSPDESLKIDGVKSGFVTAESSRPCLSFDEMIQANTGKRATIVEQFKDAAPVPHEGVIVGILQDDTPREVETSRTLPPAYGRYGQYRAPQELRETRENKDKTLAAFVMLKTETGTCLISRENIRGILLADGDPATTYTDKKQVREISVRASRSGKPVETAEVGFVYVQKGIRWIPDYRIELLGDGKARITLQATVINELADLANADLRLVVGVPSILMKDERSPIALRDAAMQLSSYFAPPSYGRGGEGRYNYLSNAIATQQSAQPIDSPGGSPAGPGPDVPTEGQREDLFVYHQPKITLKKGECTVLRLFEAVVPYEDIYTWDVGPVPPRELLERIGQDEQARMLAALTGAKAMHTIRLTNTSNQPWTTGPAAIFKDGTLLAQQLMTYTSPKNTVNVPITIATDLNTSKQEVEVGRDNDVGGHSNHRPYMTSRITLKGKLVVTNFKPDPVHMIVTRKAFGTATEANMDAKVRVNNTIEDTSIAAEGYGETWFRSPVWPTWWTYLNPVSQITWDRTIPAGESVTLEYTWYYDFRN